MKRILITGANSYIGTSFEKYIKDNFPNDFQVDTIDMIDGSWREKSFKGYDTVYHVAGIAHSDSGKISKEKEKLYRSVNTDLTIETAKKAKADGVKQFIFMSSMIVYGESSSIGKEKIITKDTKPKPANCYGDSKLQAELGIKQLEDEAFKIAIIRPPMVYGKNSKGNFHSLEKYAKKLKIFPYVKNERSMLYIENLVKFIKIIISNADSGIFYPQNKEYSNTSEIVKMIAEANGKKIILCKGFGWLLRLMSLFVRKINKAFGNFSYCQEMSDYHGANLELKDLRTSINEIVKHE